MLWCQAVLDCQRDGANFLDQDFASPGFVEAVSSNIAPTVNDDCKRSGPSSCVLTPVKSCYCRCAVSKWNGNILRDDAAVVLIATTAVAICRLGCTVYGT